MYLTPGSILSWLTCFRAYWKCRQCRLRFCIF